MKTTPRGTHGRLRGRLLARKRRRISPEQWMATPAAWASLERALWPDVDERAALDAKWADMLGEDWREKRVKPGYLYEFTLAATEAFETIKPFVDDPNYKPPFPARRWSDASDLPDERRNRGARRTESQRLGDQKRRAANAIKRKAAGGK